MLRFEQASEQDIPVINRLAGEIWPVSYKDIITDDQIGYMLDLIYSEESLKEQIIGLKHNFVLAFLDNKAVGFASYSPKVDAQDPVFRLNKIYLLPALHGKGAGKMLLNEIIRLVKHAGATALELNVNKHNPALYFYQKNEFRIIEEEVIDIGQGYVMDDYVMLLEIA